jgi:hypothetical protein
MRQLLCDRFGMKMYIFDKLDVHFGGCFDIVKGLSVQRERESVCVRRVSEGAFQG